MGVAEVIPGVSGGTLAFITGIYERLLNSINSINFKLVGILKNEGIKGVWSKIDGNFLIKVIFTSLVVVDCSASTASTIACSNELISLPSI